MHTETKTNLSHHTIQKLQQLIRATLDSSQLLQKSADVVADPVVADTLRKWAAAHSMRMEQLRVCVEANEEEPHTSGTWHGLWRRLVADVKAGIDSGSATTVLAEVDRAETHLKELYKEVLTETAGSAVNDVLQRQIAEVKLTVDEIRKLQAMYSG